MEFDWLTFYWALNRLPPNQSDWPNMFSWNDLRDLYTTACGGRCGSSDIGWAALVNTANSRWGVGSSKTNYFINKGIEYGIAE